MYISDFLKNGSTIQGNAGATAINQNDLLQLTASGNLYPVQKSDYAAIGNAATIVANTTASSYLANSSAKKDVVGTGDGGIIVAVPNSTSSVGILLQKYSASGALITSLVLDSTAQSLFSPCLQNLSNGSVAVAYSLQGNTIKYAVLNQNLGIVAPVTTITTGASAYIDLIDVIPLSGGGFAVAYAMPTGMFLAVYSNAGTVVSAGALISGSPTAGSSTQILTPKMAQLSNGNIVIAIFSSQAGLVLGHAIYTAAGAMVLSYTVLDNASAASTSGVYRPQVSVLNGYYCVAMLDSHNAVAYVLNNNGVLQGGAYSSANTSVDDVHSLKCGLANDGTAFWFVQTGGQITYIPVTGTGFIASTATLPTEIGAYIEGENLVVGGSSDTYIFKISAGAVSLYSTVTNTLGSWVTVMPIGDFSYCLYSGDTGSSTIVFTTQKYMNSAIVGISQSSVAAGNAGTLVPYSMGPGGYPCNAINGTVGKGFDHSATAIIGNKGTLLGNSAALQGIV
jgi:hypothetical protein